VSTYGLDLSQLTSGILGSFSRTISVRLSDGSPKDVLSILLKMHVYTHGDKQHAKYAQFFFSFI